MYVRVRIPHPQPKLNLSGFFRILLDMPTGISPPNQNVIKKSHPKGDIFVNYKE